MGGGGGGVGVQAIPAGSRKMVQSLKEIVNCPEPEIYAVLKDCNMDPNEAVNRLLTQDPFHEVKSKREKKKETKDPTESRPRGAGSTVNRGSRSAADRYGGRGGSTQFSSSEPGGLQGKPLYRKETESSPYTSSSASFSGVVGNNSSRRPPSLSDPDITENKASAVSGVDVITPAPQPTSGYQSAWLGAPGQKSMADIVKMGRPQSKSYNTPNPSYRNVDQNFPPVPSSTTTHQIPRSSDDYASKVSGRNHELGVAPDKPVSPDDEWPQIDSPQVAGMSSVLEPHDTELQLGTSNLSYDGNDQYIGSHTDDAHEDDNGTFEDHSLNNVESASVSMRMMQEDNTGSTTHYDEGMYNNMGSFHAQEHAYEHQEVEDSDASVSLVNANMQQLSIQEENNRTAPEDDIPSVVIPNHLQVQNADCSHLSFGSFGSAMNTTFSGSFTSRTVTSNLEETPAEADAPSVGHSDSRHPEYYGDESLRSSPDENLVRRLGGTAGAYNSATTSQPEVLKQEKADVSLESQYAFPSGTPGYNFENGQLLNTSYPQSQASAQMQNLAPFLTQQAYTNSLPSSLLGSNGHPVRESDLSYSPFLITQSMPTKYSNIVPSINSSTVSMAEALKTVGLSSTQPTQQMPSGNNNVATGPTLPQHLAVHPYSQQALSLGPFANMIGYPFLPQSYTYMPSGFQQAAFAGNSTYHQSLAAAVLPQYKNSASVSSLPQSAAAAPGYGAFGSSGTIPGNYTMNPPQAGSSISYDDVLSSQYKDNSHLLSLQQQTDNSAMWLHGGGGSRTMSAVPASTYYSFQGQNQQPSGFLRQSQQPSQQNFGSAGYPNFYHSQAGISLEHQQQNPRDGSQGQTKQSQQLWQNGY